MLGTPKLFKKCVVSPAPPATFADAFPTISVPEVVLKAPTQTFANCSFES